MSLLTQYIENWSLYFQGTFLRFVVFWFVCGYWHLRVGSGQILTLHTSQTKLIVGFGVSFLLSFLDIIVIVCIQIVTAKTQKKYSQKYYLAMSAF